MSIIQVASLTKRFRELTAVQDLSFEVPRGGVYGFLGQNGAGKSTTIRMLLTLIRPTAGSIRIFGEDLQQQRSSILRRVGAIIEKPDLYPYLSATDNLRIMGRLSGLKPTAGELSRQLDRVGLGSRAGSKVKTFSQGMKQRLGIACALLHNPELVILDEPTNGLDPQGIADIRNLILHLSRNEGKTVMISSHLLYEVELVADSMLIIDKGRKITEGRVSDLLHPADTLVALRTTDDAAARRQLQASSWAGALQTATEDGLLLRLDRNDVPLLNRDLVGLGIQVLSLQPRHSLEDYFFSLTTPHAHGTADRD
ncbi:MAG TPA: ABC transporter ATP-binding protein [Chitinophagaceae bacterium]|jgi:ABC-type multidrug transport system ATPase subunit|nr:ABC transporter ATP-binding protein [Chitinophagaceae bacterium]